jgi:hypothetical protein
MVYESHVNQNSEDSLNQLQTWQSLVTGNEAQFGYTAARIQGVRLSDKQEIGNII